MAKVVPTTELSKELSKELPKELPTELPTKLPKKQIKKVMVLDTETTGFPNYPKEIKSKFKSLTQAEKRAEKEKPEYLQYKPNIIQLSYVVYDLDHPDKSKIYDKYIFLDPETGNKISKGAERVTGLNYDILKQKLSKELSTIEDSMTELLADMEVCDLIVGHNIGYDKARLREEIQRIQQSNVFTFHADFYESYLKNLSNKDRFYCTMRNSKELCKTAGIRSRQVDVYTELFKCTPSEEAQHNSLYDVIMCLRIYMMLAHNRDICGENEEITRDILSFSPQGYVCPMPATDKPVLALETDKLATVTDKPVLALETDKPVLENFEETPKPNLRPIGCFGKLCEALTKTKVVPNKGGSKTKKRTQKRKQTKKKRKLRRPKRKTK